MVIFTSKCLKNAKLDTPMFDNLSLGFDVDLIGFYANIIIFYFRIQCFIILGLKINHLVGI